MKERRRKEKVGVTHNLLSDFRFFTEDLSLIKGSFSSFLRP
jgi:hypothetical protein